MIPQSESEVFYTSLHKGRDKPSFLYGWIQIVAFQYSHRIRMVESKRRILESQRNFQQYARSAISFPGRKQETVCADQLLIRYCVH